MEEHAPERLRYDAVELDGVRYAIVREGLLRDLCRRAGVELAATSPGPSRDRTELEDIEFDRETLARRLILRRTRAGLTQAELARRAGVRVETLNRVERGRTTPDFSTVRKLVVAMNKAETGLAAESHAGAADPEEATDAKNAEPRAGH